METPPSSFSSSVFECAAVTSPESASSDYQLDLQCHHLLLQIQRLVDRYDDCFLNLQQSLADVDLLSLDNRQLAAENLDLAFLVNKMEAEEAAATLASSSKKSLSTPESGKQQPKSISIRSPGFLTVKHPPPGSSGDGSSTYRLRTGGEEVEVYEQGTTKTELCNKWGETGRCSYGKGCRFAHGMQELRPVIRHPRFKTQLCRIVAAGGTCPYGHRCHFRHASLPDPRAG